MATDDQVNAVTAALTQRLGDAAAPALLEDINPDAFLTDAGDVDTDKLDRWAELAAPATTGAPSRDFGAGRCREGNRYRSGAAEAERRFGVRDPATEPLDENRRGGGRHGHGVGGRKEAQRRYGSDQDPSRLDGDEQWKRQGRARGWGSRP